MSLSRCQQETTYPEFLGWMVFFQEEDVAEIERTEKWEHYAARLAARILQAAGAKNVKESDELIKFKVQGMEKREPEPVTKEQRIKEAHAFWDMWIGVHKAVQPSVKKKGK